MANPVLEDLNSWQADHTAADSNLPVAASPSGIGDVQDLSGNLRLLKSVVRALAMHLSWERWLGLKNLAATGNIAFTYTSATVFTVNDNFSASGRNLAVVGRRLRATITGSVLTGSVVSAVWSSPSTTITALWDSGALDASLTEIQFGPEAVALPTTQTQNLTNRTGFTLVAGDVVAISTIDDASVVLADSLASSRRQFVVALGATANNAAGQFAAAGIVSALKVDATATVGQYLIKSTVTKCASVNIAGGAVSHDDTTPVPDGAFALALSSIGGAGIIVALLFGSTNTAVPVLATSNGYGTRTLSTSAPSGVPVDGDTWERYI